MERWAISNGFEVCPYQFGIHFSPSSLLPRDDSTTLKECGVLPGSTIEVARNENVVLSTPSIPSDPYHTTQKEQGFLGTFLQGSPVVSRNGKGKGKKEEGGGHKGGERGEEEEEEEEDVVMENVELWECQGPGCGERNREGVDKCRKCERKQDWVCGCCTLLNPDTEKECSVCRAKRPENGFI